MPNASQMASLLGAVLILSGIGIVIFQILRNPPTTTASQSADIGLNRFNVKTAYPGIVLIGFGAILVIVGALLAK